MSLSEEMPSWRALLFFLLSQVLTPVWLILPLLAFWCFPSSSFRLKLQEPIVRFLSIVWIRSERNLSHLSSKHRWILDEEVFGLFSVSSQLVPDHGYKWKLCHLSWTGGFFISFALFGRRLLLSFLLHWLPPVHMTTLPPNACLVPYADHDFPPGQHLVPVHRATFTIVKVVPAFTF